MANLGQAPAPVAAAGVPRTSASWRDWTGLVVLACAVLLIAIDATVLDLALPFLSADLGPTGAQLLWIIDVYSFAVAGLLVTMGVLGDRIGRRRVLLLGAVGFAAASAVAAWATSPEMLIAARALQGGASLLPVGVRRIEGAFHRGDAVTIRDENRVLGRGLVAYDADEATRIVGRPSREIEAILGYAGRAEMVHRDDMALDAGTTHF